ncbi:MAG: hypothetical protein ABIH69_06245 [bacterium]|nr:hypothetical protein [Candidatus Margulisiibacteriota bacterium]
MRKVILMLCCLILAASVSFAFSDTLVTTITADGADSSGLSSRMGDLSLGLVTEGTRSAYSLTWHPNFKFGPIGFGLDASYALGDSKPIGYENFVLRYVEYDDGSQGLRYGVIESLTWGHGLLIKNYTNRLAGPIVLNNEQVGVVGYFNNSQDGYLVRGLWSKTGVAGARLEEKINPNLTLGQTYVTDNDGIMIATTGRTQKVAGIGLDATTPLPIGWVGFAEWAALQNYGSGLSAGVSWDRDFTLAQASFIAAYRLLDKGFVPGYFGEGYETNPIDLSTAEATGNNKNGYLIEFKSKIMDMATLNAAYENYNDSNSASLTANAFARLPQNVEVTGYYQQPNFDNFRAISFEEGAIIGGSLAYPANQFTKLIVHYRKAYNPTTGQVESSRYYEVRFSL